ncbi:MAG: D-alanyl-D-alanine carboxypeptidase [Magnetococcales bacterium]|nr:D-alanyl-D-alanine carboxypeptidase [Magnetococcales bacterium]
MNEQSHTPRGSGNFLALRAGSGWILSGLMFLLVVSLATLATAAPKAPFKILGKGAVLGDVDSGTIMFEQDGDARLEPASLTKVMTLYLIYESLAKGELTLETELPVSEKAWRMGGSKTFVKVGDKVRVEDLVRGIAVQSGNDACIVVAEYLAGSEEGFAELMNAKAQELGLEYTHFTNATGMPAEDHYTTPRDMFVLASSLIRDFPQFSHYSREKQYTFNGIRQYNRNRLLWRDPSVTGLKTGHTRAAGYCLIATNEKDEQRLAAVVMGARNSKDREEEALRLLRYGNRMFETVRLFGAGETVRTIRVWKGEQEEVTGRLAEPLVVTVPRKERGSLEVGILYEDPLMAPLAEGQPIGTLVVKLGEEELMRKPVLADTAVPAGGIVRNMVDSVRLYLGW